MISNIIFFAAIAIHNTGLCDARDSNLVEAALSRANSLKTRKSRGANRVATQTKSEPVIDPNTPPRVEYNILDPRAYLEKRKEAKALGLEQLKERIKSGSRVDQLSKLNAMA